MIYLDNAATTQKPDCVIKAMSDFYKNRYATINRGLYPRAQKASEECERAREKIARFINAETIVFTRSTTESLNMIAYGIKDLLQGKKILVSAYEHHANLLCWQRLAKEKKLELVVIDIKENKLDMDDFYAKIDDDCAVCAIGHVSNVLGCRADVKAISATCKKHNCISVIDGAQAVGHFAVDIKDIDCDFYAFSAHKMFGPTGIGAFYGRTELLEKMKPLLVGGDMIDTVSQTDYVVAKPPRRFEAGTLPIVEIIGFAAAVDYIESIGLAAIEKKTKMLAAHAAKSLSNHGTVYWGGESIVSFTTDKSTHDIATLLGELHICVRAGHHCAIPLSEKIGLTTRISVHHTNTKEEIDTFMKTLKVILC